MDWLEAAILGMVQGLTEFLPISSSGHLRLMEHVWPGMPEENAHFEIYLHGVTLLVVLIVLRKEALELFFKPKKMGLIVCATIPTVLMVLVFDLQDHFKRAGLRFVLITECVTGLFLILSEVFSRKLNQKPRLSKPAGAALIGVAQGLAVLPGLSRSGLTLGTAFLMGWSRKEAFEFSFLMSLPVIAGAIVLNLKDILGSGETALSPVVMMSGALPAAGFGALTLILLRGWVVKSLKPFGVYCLALSLMGFLFLGEVL